MATVSHTWFYTDKTNEIQYLFHDKVCYAAMEHYNGAYNKHNRIILFISSKNIKNVEQADWFYKQLEKLAPKSYNFKEISLEPFAKALAKQSVNVDKCYKVFQIADIDNYKQILTFLTLFRIPFEYDALLNEIYKVKHKHFATQILIGHKNYYTTVYNYHGTNHAIFDNYTGKTVKPDTIWCTNTMMKKAIKANKDRSVHACFSNLLDKVNNLKKQ